MAVTIHDLARLAGLNASTVSRALRGDLRVKSSTRQRIAELAAEYGYSPNLPARQLARGKTGNIWFCFGTPDSELERWPAVRLNDLFHDCGFDLQILLHNNLPERFRQQLKKLYQRSADGAVLIPPGNTDDCEQLTELVNRLPLPHVFIDRYWEELSCPVVTTDNAAATRRLVDRCAAWGAREFYLGFSHVNPVERTRGSAARKQLEKLGLPWFPYGELIRGHRNPGARPIAVLSSDGRTIGDPPLPAGGTFFGGFFDYWENPTAGAYRKVIICRQDFDAISRISAEYLQRMLAGEKELPPLTLVPPSTFSEVEQ